MSLVKRGCAGLRRGGTGALIGQPGAATETRPWMTGTNLVMQLQAQSHQKLQEEGRTVPSSLRGGIALPTPWCQTPGLWNGERMHFCCFNPFKRDRKAVILPSPIAGHLNRF